MLRDVGGVQWQRTLGKQKFLFSALGSVLSFPRWLCICVCCTFSTIFSFFLSHSRFTRIQIFLLFSLAFVWSLEAADGAWEGAIQSQRSGSDVSVTFFVTIKHSSCRQTCKVLLITTLNPRQAFSPLHPQTPAPPAYCLSVLFAAWFGLPQWLFSYWSAASSFLDLTNCQKSSYYSSSCWDLLG